MSELVLATADICLHGTSSTLCEWCNYKSRIPHLESQLRDAKEKLDAAIALLKRFMAAARDDDSHWHTFTGEWSPSDCMTCKAVSEIPECLRGELGEL